MGEKGGELREKRLGVWVCTREKSESDLCVLMCVYIYIYMGKALCSKTKGKGKVGIPLFQIYYTHPKHHIHFSFHSFHLWTHFKFHIHSFSSFSTRAPHNHFYCILVPLKLNTNIAFLTIHKIHRPLVILSNPA